VQCMVMGGSRDFEKRVMRGSAEDNAKSVERCERLGGRVGDSSRVIMCVCVVHMRE
jgi:hypothetical protein